METDSLFYRLFKEKPKLLFELLGENVPKTAYTFGTYEVKQTSLRGDGLLKPTRSTKSPLIFLENQAYYDRREEFYSSFFTKIFLYLRDYKPPNDWRAVVLFTHRKYDPEVPIHYRDFVLTERLQRIYLNELPPEMGDRSLEMGLLQLIGLSDSDAPDRAREILNQTYAQTSDAAERQRVLEWIITVFVHKFSQLSREEIAAMLGVTKELRESRFYQDMEDEILSRAVLPLLKSGMSEEAIAEELKVAPERVKELIQIAQAED